MTIRLLMIAFCFSFLHRVSVFFCNQVFKLIPLYHQSVPSYVVECSVYWASDQETGYTHSQE